MRQFSASTAGSKPIRSEIVKEKSAPAIRHGTISFESGMRFQEDSP